MTTVSRSAVLRFFFVFALILFATAALYAQSERPVRQGPGTGKPDDEMVPWKFADKGAAIEKAPLTLYWLPATQKEMERSELLSSRPLIQDSLRCVAFAIVDPENAATIKLLGATGNLPAALLVNNQGTVTRRVEQVRGALPRTAVERMVHDELAARDEAMYHAMSEGRKRATAGEKEAAIALYRSVWNDRCFFPMAGTEAQRALKTLGVEVHDVPAPIAVDPQLKQPSLTVKPAAPPHGGGEHH
ncbi:MAG: hypothetical protein QOK37_2224 [Thermoanaerobaculia bacterium]|jgi:hypothetical protein|nr:hypothetical protein [Thermoanaerobaculia bacterium]